MTDLVVISLEEWDGVWRRNQHLVSRLLAGDETMRVLFVEPSADPVHEIRSGRRPSLGRGVRERSEVAPRLWTLRPLKVLPRRIDPRSDLSFAHTVMRAARRLGMTDPVLWINEPAASELSRMTGWPTVYDITDDWAVAERAERIRKRIVAGERYLLQNAPRVVVCSAELLRRKSPDRPAELPPITLIPNGVDLELYRRQATRPADLPAGPVALYVGTLHDDRLDVELCVDTAQRLAGAGSVVLVGPNALSERDTSALLGAGVVLLGPRTHEKVPAYMQHADVLLVPHLVNAFTDSLDPIKLYEYQAVGRPVVATAVAGFRDAENDAIAAVPRAEYATAVLTAVSTAVKREPKSKVNLRSWDERAASMRETISSLLAN